MPTVGLNLRRPGRHIEQWHVAVPPYRSFIEFGDRSYPGLMHPATIKLTVNGPAIDLLLGAWSLGSTIDVSLPGFMESRGLVDSIKTNESLDGRRTADVVLRLTGAPWKNHMAEAQERAPAVITSLATTKERPVKIRNKFYVAAPSVTTHAEQDQDNTAKNVRLATTEHCGKWTRKDLAAAIAHAQSILENDPAKDHVAVVKIVKLVRRPKPKFVVEDVK